jgi:hypothetical protein
LQFGHCCNYSLRKYRWEWVFIIFPLTFWMEERVYNNACNLMGNLNYF